MAKVKINDIELYYEVHGTGEPLICLSGFTADHLSWTSVLEKFTKKFQVILLDNRGVGLTAVPNYPYTVEMMALDTLALMDVLEIDKAHFMGHSMGGMIAMNLALLQPEKVMKLVLCNTIEKTTTVARLAFEFMNQLMSNGMTMRQVFPSFVPWLFSNTYLDIPGNLELILEHNRKQNHEMSQIAFKNQLNAILAFDARLFLNKLKFPTLLIAGEYDRITPPNFARIMKRIIAGSQLSIIPGAAHMSHIEKPELFSDLVLPFLER